LGGQHGKVRFKKKSRINANGKWPQKGGMKNKPTVTRIERERAMGCFGGTAARSKQINDHCIMTR